MALGVVMLFLLAGGWLIVAFAPGVILRSCHAVEVRNDQAPNAFSILVDLSASAGCEPPRLFVLPLGQANGFALAGRHRMMVALTEEVFERLSIGQLRGMLAILIAMASHPGARLTTSLAALAIVLIPIVPVAGRLCRWGLPTDRWFEIDRRAAELVGASGVIAALRALTPAADATRPPDRMAASNLFCTSSPVDDPYSQYTTHPSVESRTKRLAAMLPSGAASAPSPSPE